MKINQIASKPQLIKVVVDDKALVKEYGEAIEFWTWDRQPLEVFMKLAQIKDNQEEIIVLVKDLILDEEGNKVLTDDVMLPTKVLLQVIQKVVETLGK